MSPAVFSYADPSSPRLKRGLIRAMEVATGQKILKRLYESHQANPPDGESFWQAAIRLLALDVRFQRASLEAVPREGPVVIVANHPYGVLDGLVISWLAEQVRPDFKVLTHSLLLRAPEARPQLLAVDFSETPEARRTNLASRAAARAHLAAGGCLIVFPAGGISTVPDKLGRGIAVDAPWQPFTAQLIQRARATVVPMRFAGQNSRLFQIASHVSLTLRLSLIFREVKNRIGTAVGVTIGAPVTFEDLERIGDRRDLTATLRAMVEALPPHPGTNAPTSRPRLIRTLGRRRPPLAA